MTSIPDIKPYAMPGESELPGNTAPWRVDPARAVLLIHDMQKFFLRPFPAGESPVVDLVKNVALLRRRCAESGVPVAYTLQPGDMTADQRGLLKDFWGAGMSTAPAHQEVAGGLTPAPGDWLLTKWRYSAFHRTDLLARIRADDRDQLIVCGVYAHIGVLMTLADAFAHDIKPFVVADAVADFSLGYHRLALEYAADRCAVVTTIKTLLAGWPDAEQTREGRS